MSDLHLSDHADVPEDAPRRTRRWVPWTAGGVVGVLAVGGGVAAAQWYFGEGPQAAEALPASTLAYASVNLDPSGEQQLAARALLERFPVWEKADVDSDDDIRKWLVEDVFDNLECDEIDYDDDLAPWLGDRVAVAVVPAGENDEPELVIVAQADDEDAADDALEQLRDCAHADVSWDHADGWAIVAEKQSTVDEVIDDAADSTLAEDDTYRELVGAVGGPGLVTGYVSPQAPQAFSDEISAEADFPAGLWTMVSEDFEGLAASLRVEDDALEISTAGAFAPGPLTAGAVDDGAADLLARAPAGTSLAYALGLPGGWARDALDVLREAGGPEASMATAMLRELEEELGEKPAPFAERLLGDAAMLVVGESAQEVALRIEGGDARTVEAWERVRTVVDDPTVTTMIVVSRKDDVVVVGPDPGYRAAVLEPDQTLADGDDLEEVVPELDRATGAVYVDFGSALADHLLESVPAEVSENLRPLDRAGLNSWYDDGLTRARIRITVD